MLTGRAVFAGDTVTDTLAAILEREPDWSALPDATPTHLRRLLQRCLEKDPKRRLRDIGDARLDLDAVPDAPAGALSSRASRPLTRAVVMGGTVVVGLTAFAVWRFANTDDPVTRTATRLEIPFGDGDIAPYGPVAALSRDGKRVVYAANRRLYLRTFDRLEAVPILGTEPPPQLGSGRNLGFASNPFLSPDGLWVGFSQATELRKIPASGGVATTIANLADTQGGAIGPYGPITWNADDTILFAATRAEGRSSGLWMVPAAGGSPQLIVPLEMGQIATAPQMLPGGTDVLFTVSSGQTWDDADIVVQSPKTRERHVLIHGGLGGRYVASGHLIYGFHGTLYGVQVDAKAHRIVGSPVPLVSNVAQMTAMPGWGSFQYWLSDDGTLVYLPKGIEVSNSLLVWVDRQGHQQPLSAEPRAYQYPRISPDGRRVALDLRDQQYDIWLWEFERGALTRLTFGRQSGGTTTWSRDGQRVVFGPDQAGTLNLFWQPVNGTSGPERLLTSPNVQYADAFSPDGRELVYDEVDPKTKYDVRVLSMDGTHASKPLVRTPFNEQNADLSPDGRWIAYQSDESGRAEVYVRPYPDVNSGRWQVSTSGGTRPQWSRDGRELFFLDAERWMMATGVRTNAGFGVGAATRLFDTRPLSLSGIGRNFDVSPDGSRFLMTKDLQPPADAKRLIVAQNWFEELKRLVPLK